MVTESYTASIYMSKDFYDQYYLPFLEIADMDENLDINLLKIRKKRGRKKTKLKPEIESPAVRALIKQYVDFHKEEMLNKEEQEETENNIKEKE